MPNYAMSTEEGNSLVSRIVDAATKLHNNDGATLGEVEKFVELQLSRLDHAGYTEAFTLPVIKQVLLHFALRIEA